MGATVLRHKPVPVQGVPIGRGKLHGVHTHPCIRPSALALKRQMGVQVLLVGGFQCRPRMGGGVGGKGRGKGHSGSKQVIYLTAW